MEEKKLLVNGLSINYKAFGQGKPVLVLHGWGGKSDSWVEVGKLLTKSGYQVVIPDLPGFGVSQEPQNAWQFSDYLRWVDDFAAALKLDKFVLIGHSVGGALACAYAAQYQIKVEKLVLCDAAIVREERLDWRQKEARKLAAKKHLLMKVPFARQLYPLAQRIVYNIAGVHDYQLATPVMKETFKNVVGVDTSKYARKIKISTLIVWGDQDKATPLSDAYEISHQLINSKLITIPGAAHNPHKTHPQKLAGIIESFLASNAKS